MNNPAQEQAELEKLLEYIKYNRGFDFTGYKRSSLMRRVLKRMQMVGVEGFENYQDFLEVHPEEFVQLFNTILINVTGFFRDPKAWEMIETSILPVILAGKGEHSQIRVWSAGCASGEEAYTISMLLAEQLGSDGFKERVKVYATDLDEEALGKARLANYSENEIEGIPVRLVEKYFDQIGSRYIFNKELRRSVIFGRHDLIQDAPISRIDLLICRNILMYFNRETQAMILARLNYALADSGFLFLGKAEMLMSHANLFTAVDLRNRIFAKSPETTMRDRLLSIVQNSSEDTNHTIVGHAQFRDAAFDAGGVAQVVVDARGMLMLVNEKARSLFNISLRDLGRPFQDLELSYRPVELRSSIEQAYAVKSMIALRDVELPRSTGDSIQLDVLVTPLKLNNGTIVGVSITFFDVSDHKRLQMHLEHTNQELETAMEELQSTNEELETTNEELQSTIDELETTNEELQSTNEELETMNEELQSTNEELETMNDELNLRTAEINHANAFLQSILTSMRGSVIVLDNNMNVQLWNRKSEDMWGLRMDEVAKHSLFGLDIGLPVDQLKKPVRSILNQETDCIDLLIDATNRRGRAIICAVTCSALNTINNEVQGVIIIIEQRDGASG